MEMVDSATGDIYCTWIQNGEWQKTKGACDNANTEIPLVNGGQTGSGGSGGPEQPPVEENPPADDGQTDGGQTGGGEQPPAEDPTVVSGCTDSSATNYNSSATQDDGSCQYPPVEENPPADGGQTDGGVTGGGEQPPAEDPTVVYGCTDSSATNYNSSATQDDGSCQYPPVEENPPAETSPPAEEPPAEEPV